MPSFFLIFVEGTHSSIKLFSKNPVVVQRENIRIRTPFSSLKKKKKNYQGKLVFPGRRNGNLSLFLLTVSIKHDPYKTIIQSSLPFSKLSFKRLAKTLGGKKHKIIYLICIDISVLK